MNHRTAPTDADPALQPMFAGNPVLADVAPAMAFSGKEFGIRAAAFVEAARELARGGGT